MNISDLYVVEVLLHVLLANKYTDSLVCVEAIASNHSDSAGLKDYSIKTRNEFVLCKRESLFMTCVVLSEFVSVWSCHPSSILYSQSICQLALHIII